MPRDSLLVRDALADDMPAVQRIYAGEVTTGVATFEEVPPTVDDMLARRAAVLDAGLPYLVAETDGGVHQVIGVIGDSGNAGSIELHKALGFRHVGTLTAVGYKFGRWVDTVLMQRDLT